jgi:hypothetical protein
MDGIGCPNFSLALDAEDRVHTERRDAHHSHHKRHRQRLRQY